MQSGESSAATAVSGAAASLPQNDVVMADVHEFKNPMSTNSILYLDEKALSLLLSWLQKRVEQTKPGQPAAVPISEGSSRIAEQEISPEIKHDAKAIINITYRNSLLQRSEAGFTSLHFALQEKDSVQRNAYFSRLRCARTEKIISDVEYKRILIEESSFPIRFTPWHLALLIEGVVSLDLYFSEIRDARQKEIISVQEYRNLFMGKSLSGLTLLQTSFSMGHPACSSCLAEVKLAHEEKSISDQDYKNLLIGPNPAGFTLLDDVLKAGNPEMVIVYSFYFS